MVPFIFNGEDKRLLIHVSIFTLQGNTIRLASFQNIKEELDKGEFESWQKLIRVLTHEITNSVTPIMATCQGMIREIPESIEDERIQRLSKGILIIEYRSGKLIDFVKKFRGFSLIPAIKPEWINPSTLIDGVVNLFTEEAKDQGITIIFGNDITNIKINVDSGLLQQVLINLFRNAFQSFEGIINPIVKVEIRLIEKLKLMIQFTDNGCGVKPQNLDKVFIPFYTTRKDGSGIGLSFSRQVMHLHGGTITFDSNEENGTTLTLIFPENRVKIVA
jgi:signal transduction histidine kinase